MPTATHSWGRSTDWKRKSSVTGSITSVVLVAANVALPNFDSGMIDYDEVLRFILDLIERNQWNVRAICYDPFAMGYLIPEFEKRDLPLLEVRQGVRTLSIPTTRFRDDLFNGQLKHPDNPVTGLCGQQRYSEI